MPTITKGMSKLTSRQRAALKALNSFDSNKQLRDFANVTIPMPGRHKHQFHAYLQCAVERMSYDWTNKRGDLWCQGFTDMTAAINLFESIDIDVRVIKTYWVGKSDTIYRRESDGQWQAYRPRRTS